MKSTMGNKRWAMLLSIGAAVVVLLLPMNSLIAHNEDSRRYQGRRTTGDLRRRLSDSVAVDQDSSSTSTLLDEDNNNSTNTTTTTTEEKEEVQQSPAIPSILYEKEIYTEEDFRNENGIIPPFWQETESDSGNQIWGPCFPPSSSSSQSDNNNNNIDWNDAISRFNQTHELQYTHIHGGLSSTDLKKEDLGGFCRPGFLIIGQGKCGTSSLYHYLTGHPRVAPASQKQIHYFRYYSNFPMKWYLSHFPNTQTFLASGSLMSGEASPGYLPYPGVAALTQQRMPGPKIICVGRNPLDRSWSSYRYNYVNPAIGKFRKGRIQGIPKDLTDEEYEEHYLFSFEDMLKAELAVLRTCLAPGGVGITGARSAFGDHTFHPEYERREREGLPPMADIDGQCYGGFHSNAAPRRQWIEMAKVQPRKFLNVPNLHLTQSIIGRSLYVYPLEWWHALFPKEDLHFVCTEEMRDMTGEPLNQLGLFLGLPSFNFSGVVSEGMYNVGGHKGYDTVTSWEEVAEESGQTTADNPDNGSNNNSTTAKDGIPLSDEFRKEMLEFFKPHNERLFELIGKRCDWEQ